jgi:polysaccharide export outer membrane protein
MENGKQQKIAFNYKDVIKGNHPEQNIELKPGDTVVVP